MSLENKIKSGLVQALKEQFNIDTETEKIALEPTKKEFEGAWTFVVFPYVKPAKTNPETLANTLGETLKNSINEVTGYNVVRGFLNISISDNHYVQNIKDLVQGKVVKPSKKADKVMVEYSSPNTNKPLHLGHLRNNFLGYSISKILEANGYDVVKANLVNDRGIHICKSMIAYEKFGNGETPESSGLKGDHLVGKYYVAFDKEYKYQMETLVAKGMDQEQAKKDAPIMKEAQKMLLDWENQVPAVVSLWKKMNGWVYDGFNATYKKIGVQFDHFYYESSTYLLGKDIVEEGLSKGVFYKKEDGSVWIDLTSDGLDHKLLLRGDGTSVYITQDLGTAELKYKDFGCNKSIYVVGNEQDYHFQVLQLILKRLQKPYADGVYHMSYGMVDLPSGKMKSREGTVVDADDLVDEMIQTAKSRTLELGKVNELTTEQAEHLYQQLGLGALKYFLLRVDPKKRMLFNPEESIDFQGNTGPFIQYTHARIASLLRRAIDMNINILESYELNSALNPAEVEVIELLMRNTAKIEEAGREYSPSVIAQYVYEVAKAYNRFYAECPIFQLEDKALQTFRLQISKSVAETIKTNMLLLGIEVPEKM
jgi:arginyl-tRNA synthetase